MQFCISVRLANICLINQVLINGYANFEMSSDVSYDNITKDNSKLNNLASYSYQNNVSGCL